MTVCVYFSWILMWDTYFAGEFTEEPGQFRFLCTACLTDLKDSVGWIFVKPSEMRVTIPLDLSTRSFILSVASFALVVTPSS